MLVFSGSNINRQIWEKATYNDFCNRDIFRLLSSRNFFRSQEPQPISRVGTNISCWRGADIHSIFLFWTGSSPLDFSNSCEGGCWELGGAGELVGCLGSFLYIQLSNELECFRHFFHLLSVFCNDCSICGEVNPRNQRKNARRNSSKHQLIEKEKG